MNTGSVVIGVLAIGFGIFTAVLRKTNPSRLGKLEAMKKQLGPGAGSAIHLISYTLVPILFGITALILGLNGKSFLGR